MLGNRTPYVSSCVSLSLAAHVVLGVAGILLMQGMIRAMRVLHLAALMAMAMVMVPVLAMLVLVAVVSLAVMHILRRVGIHRSRRAYSASSACPTRIGHRRPVLSAALSRSELLRTRGAERLAAAAREPTSAMRADSLPATYWPAGQIVAAFMPSAPPDCVGSYV